eukprot:626133-Prymnesium_polylepis.1
MGRLAEDGDGGGVGTAEMPPPGRTAATQERAASGENGGTTVGSSSSGWASGKAAPSMSWK